MARENGGILREQVRALNRKKTKADRIRAMSNEELATFIDEFWSSPWCPDEPPINTDTLECLMHDDDCKLCILDWLKQEVSDGSNV